MTSLRSSVRFSLLAVVALALASCASSPADAPALRGEERLFYELEVTLPGTRSQGVHGRLFDRDGRSISVAADGAIGAEGAASGGSVVTNAGTFVSRPRVHLWDVWGMIAEATPVVTMNDPTVDGPVRFRLYVSAECTRSEGWRGELLSEEGTPLPESAGPLDTPMGRFSVRASSSAFGQRGWFPETWPPPQPGPGRWPCG